MGGVRALRGPSGMNLDGLFSSAQGICFAQTMLCPSRRSRSQLVTQLRIASERQGSAQMAHQDRINEAVKDCVRRALGNHNPLAHLQDCINEHRARGWSKADLEVVRNTCLRMLSMIYDVGVAEADDQAK